jgi:hypothetical protein
VVSESAALAELAELAALERPAAPGFVHFLDTTPLLPRYAIPPYLITKGLHGDSYLGHTSTIPYIPISRRHRWVYFLDGTPAPPHPF